MRTAAIAILLLAISAPLHAEGIAQTGPSPSRTAVGAEKGPRPGGTSITFAKPQIVPRPLREEIPPPGTGYARNIRHGKPENSARNMEQLRRFYADIVP